MSNRNYGLSFFKGYKQSCKFIILFVFLSMQSVSLAQVSVLLQQPPPNQLRAADIWKLTLVNLSKSTINVTLIGTLEEAGLGNILEGNSKPISLLPGTRKITYDDVKSGNVNFKSGKWREAFTRTGNAPSGDYTVCIQLKDESGALLGSDCIKQKVEISSPPSLVSPAYGENIDQKQRILFTWLPPMPTPSWQIKFKIKIVEILGNQSPEIAIQRNPSWFENSDIRTTMFQYPVWARKFETGKKYAWTLQSAGAEREANRSTEVFMFNVGVQNSITINLPVIDETDSTSLANRKFDPQPTDSTSTMTGRKFDPQPTDSASTMTGKKIDPQPTDSTQSLIYDRWGNLIARSNSEGYIIEFLENGKSVNRIKTDKEGNFTLLLLSDGIYTVEIHRVPNGSSTLEGAMKLTILDVGFIIQQPRLGNDVGQDRIQTEPKEIIVGKNTKSCIGCLYLTKEHHYKGSITLVK